MRPELNLSGRTRLFQIAETIVPALPLVHTFVYHIGRTTEALELSNEKEVKKRQRIGIKDFVSSAVFELARGFLLVWAFGLYQADQKIPALAAFTAYWIGGILHSNAVWERIYSDNPPRRR